MIFLLILFFNIKVVENLTLYFFFILHFYKVSVVCGFVRVTQITPVYEFNEVFFF
jgi:hypothetical protein